MRSLHFREKYSMNKYCGCLYQIKNILALYCIWLVFLSNVSQMLNGFILYLICKVYMPGQWMVFLYQTFVKRRCAFCVQLYSSAGRRKRLSRTLSLFLSRTFWSEQYFYSDLDNISVVIWIIFLLWSEQYFYCDQNNISVVIWILFLLWSEQYFSKTEYIFSC